MKKALIVVDVQNDFAHPNGSLYVKDGENIVPVVNRLTKEAAEVDALNIFSRDWHPPVTPHFTKWPTHCVQNSWGAKFHENLEIPNSSLVVSKGTGQTDGYSAFDSDVEMHFTVSGVNFTSSLNFGPSPALSWVLGFNLVDTIFVCGLATDYCVKETAVASARTGFKTFLIEDACRAVNIVPDDGKKAITEMRNEGVIIISTEKVLNGRLFA